MFDTIKKRWFEYWDWALRLPAFCSITIFVVTTIIPIFFLIWGIVAALDFHLKSKCLDSQLARRWSPAERICQEYHDGAWIKADLSGSNIYYYNDVASREH